MPNFSKLHQTLNELDDNYSVMQARKWVNDIEDDYKSLKNKYDALLEDTNWKVKLANEFMSADYGAMTVQLSPDKKKCIDIYYLRLTDKWVIDVVDYAVHPDIQDTYDTQKFNTFEEALHKAKNFWKTTDEHISDLGY